MSEKTVLVQKKDRIYTLVMNRPEVMNALNEELVNELLKALEKIASDEAIRVVVLEGAGGNFSSGADMSLFLQNATAPEWLVGMKRFGRLVRMIREIPQPVITKVRGAAVGGGINLALAGDFVFASHDARLCENFVHIGAVLDGGGTYFLPRLVGLVKARELALLGDFFDGKTAASMGLIYKSVPDEDLDLEVETLAKRLSGKSLKAMGLIKAGLDGSFDMSLNEVLEWEAAHQAVMLQTTEHKEAVKNFLMSRGKLKN
jgi:2-(1,2-epoxy-1,2-dihydrophenyl)acetyl-CoA isomerase